ncbi:MAG: methionine adenosyltransferase [Clostridium sp.]|nr:methionine adenosyltransferase [Clostridium sp.]
MKKLFTSESVTEGHPDKVCDQISDAILDNILKEDPMARVACETAVTTGMVLVMGEITTSCYVDIPKIVRETVKEIGYTRAKFGFDAETCAVLTAIDEQSRDIAMGVDLIDEEDQLGAGDQGMMFGFATNETSNFMPLPIDLAQKLAKRLSEVRKDKTLKYLRPDGKSQVTIEYDGEKPIRIDSVVISTQHAPKVTQKVLKEDVKKHVIDVILPRNLVDENTKYYINPTGRFEIGGPQGDSGLTGRKIIVDTYGGFGKHGGGAFSGKDPTKVDRSGAYAARWVAKNLVAAGVSDKLELELAYVIGVPSPVSIGVNTFGTEKISVESITKIISSLFDLRLISIIDTLDLRKPRYRDVAAYGHFGREDLDLPWEKLNRVDEIKSFIKNEKLK